MFAAGSCRGEVIVNIAGDVFVGNMTGDHTFKPCKGKPVDLGRYPGLAPARTERHCPVSGHIDDAMSSDSDDNERAAAAAKAEKEEAAREAAAEDARIQKALQRMQDEEKDPQ
jgi:hypothetical protein